MKRATIFAVVTFVVASCAVLLGFAGGAAIAQTVWPSSVTVHYEPDAPEPKPEPQEADFHNLIPPAPLETWSGPDGALTANTLPEGMLVPKPEPPEGRWYGSAITPRTEYTKEITVGAWRWQNHSKCYDVLGDYSAISCDDLKARFDAIADQPKLDRDGRQVCLNRGTDWEKCYTNREYYEELYGMSWADYVADEIKWSEFSVGTSSTKVVKADGTDPSDIPTFACDRGTCQLHPDNDADDLAAYGAAEAEIPTLLQFIADYTITTTITVVDRTAAYAQYHDDSATIGAHNVAVQVAREPVKGCDAVCDREYRAALGKWEHETDPENAHDHFVYRTDKSREAGMYVDCRLDGCVLVNPVR